MDRPVFSSAIGKTPLIALAKLSPRRRRSHLPEVGRREPDRQHEGPHGARDGRARSRERAPRARASRSWSTPAEHGRVARDGGRRARPPGAHRGYDVVADEKIR
jgi:hypothetical protein